MACCPPKKTEKHMKRSREGRSSFGPALRLNLGNRVANPRVHRSSSWLEEWRCKSQEKNQQWYRWWWWWRRRRLHFKSQEKERVRWKLPNVCTVVILGMLSFNFLLQVTAKKLVLWKEKAQKIIKLFFMFSKLWIIRKFHDHIVWLFPETLLIS